MAGSIISAWPDVWAEAAAAQLDRRRPVADGLRAAAIPLTAERTIRQIPLRAFVEEAWPILEPTTPFVPGWHLDAIVDHLEAVTRGDIRQLLINMPPRFAKSLLVSVFWPCWVWTQAPSFRWLFASYAQSLSTRDSLKCRRLLTSGWYQRHWGGVFQLTTDQREKTRFDNDCTGYRLATSVGGAATGEGGDGIVVDDPHNVREAESTADRTAVLDWWDRTMSTRGNDPATVRKVIVMQRLHEQDLAGHLLAKGGWEHLCLPMEYERPHGPVPTPTAIGWQDPRTEPGALLWPERFGPEEVAQLKLDLGSYGAAGQLQQRPSPAEGGILKRHWFGFWQPRGTQLPPVPVTLPDGTRREIVPIDLPARFALQLQSWDMAFKDFKASDFVAGGVWAQLGAQCFLLDQVHARLSFPRTLDAVTTMTTKWPAALMKLVEDKANGPAVIQTLQTKVAGLIAVTPEGGKVARAHAVAPTVEAGNVFLPHPAVAPWVWDFLEECAAFPNGAYDDQVDQMTQALHRLQLSRRTAPQVPVSTSYGVP